MDPKRVLIVEPDHDFALSLASLFRDDGHATAVARSAAEAEMEIASRRPALVVIRAELPDLSGFSFCAHLRHDRATAHLPVVLFSSDTPPESLAEHARTPWAANGYLAMPLDTDALRVLANRILATEEPVESADDAILESDDLVVQELHGQEIAPTPETAAVAAPEAPGEPAVPALPRRSVLTDDDRLFLDRVFQSIAEHREDLAREAMARRPPPRRDLLATPEGRIDALRQDLKWREAQIARIAEIWEIRERELASFDQRIHERDVDIAGLRSQVDDLTRRVVEARDLFVEKEREYGASIDGLLLEKFSQEKQLIEVVASNERRIHELERDLRRRDDDLAQRRVTLAEAQEEIARLDRQARAETARVEARERELSGELSRRTAEVAAAAEALALARREAEQASAVLEARARQAEEALVAAEGERERSASTSRELAALLQTRIDERESAIGEREARLRQLDEEYRRFREGARAREDDLAREVQDHLQQIGSLEAELESVERDSAEREPLPALAPADAEEERADLRAEAEASAGRAAEAERLLAGAEEALEDSRARLAELERALAAAHHDARLEAAVAEAGAAREAAEEGKDEVRAVEALLAAAEAARDGALARVQALEAGAREHDQDLAELTDRNDEQLKLLAVARREVERLGAELSAARHGAMIAESGLRGELEAARVRSEELAGLLAQASAERDGLRVRQGITAGDLETRDAELASAVEEAKEARAGRERAELLAAEATRRAELFGTERREAEQRSAGLVREAETRFREELARRDEQRGQEVQRLQALLEERRSREKSLELELAKAREARATPAPAGAGPGPDGSSRG